MIAALVVLFVPRLLRLSDDIDGAHVQGLVGDLVFVRLGNNVHVAPEVVWKIVVDSLGEVEVLKLGKGLEGWSRDDVDAKDFSQAMIVKVKRVLGSETAVLICIHCSGIFDDVDIFWWPSCCDVADHYLL